jgi:hypothetical protein
LRQLFFTARISLRDDEFFDDKRDHEFENSTLSALQGSRSGADASFKYLESQEKNRWRQAFADSHGVSNFALENETKALAFCAARSHIVAVR